MRRVAFHAVTWLLAAALLGACAGRRHGGVRAGGGPRQVLKGKAVYYSSVYHGRKTASGEIYDENRLTAAHRTLPFGTYVEVTNLRNDKKVVVKINDRGPFGKKERIIDLSLAAAKKLDMVRAGVVDVVVRIVKK